MVVSLSLIYDRLIKQKCGATNCFCNGTEFYHYSFIYSSCQPSIYLFVRLFNNVTYFRTFGTPKSLLGDRIKLIPQYCIAHPLRHNFEGR